MESRGDKPIFPKGAFNPYEPPPLPLKDIFKRYRKLGLTEISQDEAILDLATGRLPDEIITLRSTSIEHTSALFAQFLGEDLAHTEQVTYGHKALPGLLLLPSIIPLPVQKRLLGRLFHEELSKPEHQTNLHLHYNIPYPEGGHDSHDKTPCTPQSFFSYSPGFDPIFLPKELSSHEPLTITKVMDKSLRWMTLGGQYDWTRKVYPEEEPPAFPADIAGMLEGLFPAMKAQAAIVNLYSPRDTLSLHRDVSEEVDKGLVSISIGCDCLFVIGLHDASDTIVLRLRSGDVLYMSGIARYAWHGVPRIISETCPAELGDWPAGSGDFEEWRGWIKNKRINLNVRQMFET